MKTILKKSGKLKVGKSNIATSGISNIISKYLKPNTLVEYSIEVSQNDLVLLTRKKVQKTIRKTHENLGKIQIISPKLVPGETVDYSITVYESKQKEDI